MTKLQEGWSKQWDSKLLFEKWTGMIGPTEEVENMGTVFSEHIALTFASSLAIDRFRKNAGPRQVKSPQIGLTHNLGGGVP